MARCGSLHHSFHQHAGDVSGDPLWPGARPCIVRSINTAVTYGETPLLPGARPCIIRAIITAVTYRDEAGRQPLFAQPVSSSASLLCHWGGSKANRSIVFARV